MNTKYSKIVFVVFIVLVASMICTADARNLLQILSDNNAFNNNQLNIPGNLGGKQVNSIATSGGTNN